GPASGAARRGVSAAKPPVSTHRNVRPACVARATRRSRVTPGASSTIARRAPTMRLNSADLPTFGRPTIATTGSSGATVSTRPAIPPSEPQLAEPSRVLAPARLHPHEQLGKDTAPEQRLERLARVAADLAQPLSLAADHDGLVARPLDQDGDGDHDQPLRRPLLEALGDGRRAVRHLVPGGEEDLLADQLLRE